MPTVHTPSHYASQNDTPFIPATPPTVYTARANPFLPLYTRSRRPQSTRADPPATRLYLYDNSVIYNAARLQFILCPPDGEPGDSAMIFRLDHGNPPRYSVLPILYLPWKGALLPTLQSNIYFKRDTDEEARRSLFQVCPVPGCRIAEVMHLVQNSLHEPVGGSGPWVSCILDLLLEEAFFDENNWQDLVGWVRGLRPQLAFSTLPFLV